jgi:hypothetical protein
MKFLAPVTSLYVTSKCSWMTAITRVAIVSASRSGAPIAGATSDSAYIENPLWSVDAVFGQLPVQVQRQKVFDLCSLVPKRGNTPR